MGSCSAGVPAGFLGSSISTWRIRAALHLDGRVARRYASLGFGHLFWLHQILELLAREIP